MALPSTILRFRIDLSDVDQGIYQEVELRIAQHPSETNAFLVTRVLAYLMHIKEEVTLSRAGLCDPDDPPLCVKDLTGQIIDWIEIGLPAATRLHKATKLANRVFVYCHKEAKVHLNMLRSSSIHRVEEIRFFTLSRTFIEAISETVERTNEWSFVRTEGQIFVSIKDDHFQGELVKHTLT